MILSERPDTIGGWKVNVMKKPLVPGMSRVLTGATVILMLALFVSAMACSSDSDTVVASGDDATTAPTRVATSAPQPTSTTAPTPVPQATATQAPVAATSDPDEKPVNFQGSMKVNPARATMGSEVTVSGTGLPGNTELALNWSTVDGEWNIKGERNEEYHGRVFTPRTILLATVKTDSSGDFIQTITVPDDFGFTHNLTLETDAAILNRAGFFVEPTASISPTSGPLGTPITVTMKGVGYAYLENSFMLMYDNQFTGVLTSVTTNGTAMAVIPATGSVGTHVLRILHGAFNYPYLNGQQNPHPDQPFFNLEFEIMEGDPILPLPAAQQGFPIVAGTAPEQSGTGPSVWLDTISGPINTPVTLHGQGFAPGTEVEFNWFRVVGNRISGSGWDESSTTLGTVTADQSGNLELAFETLDDLGGPHRIEAVSGGKLLATTSFLMTPSIMPMAVTSGKAGTMLTVNLKGVGWTETANIYNFTYDNAYSGYACGFNSQGDVTVYLPLAGEPGWHFIDIYPGIYKGKEISGVQNFRIPQLTYAEDHPGEHLPAFHVAVYVEP